MLLGSVCAFLWLIGPISCSQLSFSCRNFPLPGFLLATSDSVSLALVEGRVDINMNISLGARHHKYPATNQSSGSSVCCIEQISDGIDVVALIDLHADITGVIRVNVGIMGSDLSVDVSLSGQVFFLFTPSIDFDCLRLVTKMPNLSNLVLSGLTLPPWAASYRERFQLEIQQLIMQKVEQQVRQGHLDAAFAPFAANVTCEKPHRTPVPLEEQQDESVQHLSSFLTPPGGKFQFPVSFSAFKVGEGAPLNLFGDRNGWFRSVDFFLTISHSKQPNYIIFEIWNLTATACGNVCTVPAELETLLGLQRECSMDVDRGHILFSYQLSSNASQFRLENVESECEVTPINCEQRTCRLNAGPKKRTSGDVSTCVDARITALVKQFVQERVLALAQDANFSLLLSGDAIPPRAPLSIPGFIGLMVFFLLAFIASVTIIVCALRRLAPKKKNKDAESSNEAVQL